MKLLVGMFVTLLGLFVGHQAAFADVVIVGQKTKVTSDGRHYAHCYSHEHLGTLSTNSHTGYGLKLVNSDLVLDQSYSVGVCTGSNGVFKVDGYEGPKFPYVLLVSLSGRNFFTRYIGHAEYTFERKGYYTASVELPLAKIFSAKELADLAAGQTLTRQIYTNIGGSSEPGCKDDLPQNCWFNNFWERGGWIEFSISLTKGVHVLSQD